MTNKILPSFDDPDFDITRKVLREALKIPGEKPRRIEEEEVFLYESDEGIVIEIRDDKEEVTEEMITREMTELLDKILGSDFDRGKVSDTILDVMASYGFLEDYS